VKQIRMWHGTEDATYHIRFGELVINLTRTELRDFVRVLCEFNKAVQSEKGIEPYKTFTVKVP
jgi:hypothetical protein